MSIWTFFFVLALWLALSNGQKLDEPITIDARENEPIRLSCHFPPNTNEELLVFYWMRTNHDTVDNVAMQTNTLVDQYQLDFDLQQGRYDLFISSAAYYRDNGRFECKIKRRKTGDTVYQVTYRLTILIPPGKPVIEPQIPIAREGQAFELTCSSFGGSPDPEVEWFRNGVPIAGNLLTTGKKDVPTRNVLKIVPNMADDQLPYTCRVSNRALTRDNYYETKVTLNVHYVPRVSVGPFNPLNVLKGGNAFMHCSYQANPPARKITWYRNDRLIQPTANHSIIEVEPSDAGQYRCEVDNDIHDQHDRPGSAELQLNVLYAPIVSVPPLLEPSLQEPLQLQCEVDAQPAPDRIAWYRTSGPDTTNAAHVSFDLSNIKPLAEGPLLQIERLTPADSGLYTCVAENRLAPNDRSIVYTRTANASTEVRVQHAPTRVRITSEAPVAIAGRPYQMSCSAEPSAYPLPKYRWWRENDEQTTLSNSNNLTMVTVHVRQEGRYFCQAENSLGRSEPTSIQMTVQELPSITIQMKPEWIKKQGERGFSLTCRARGKPTPTVTWLHDGQVISSQGNEQTAMHRVDTVENVDNVHSVQSVLYFESPARRNGDELLAADHGRYQCAFSNPLSTEAVRAETYLRIEHSPVLKHLHNRVAFDLNQSAALRCEMSAYPKPSFEWYFENRLLETRAGKYTMNVTQMQDDVYLAILMVHGLTTNDYGEYTCRAWNNVDDDDERTIIKLLERSEPEAPGNVQVIETGAEFAMLSWQSGFDGGYADTEYVVSYSSQDSHFSRWRNESCRTVNPCKLMGLRSRTNYAFRVTAVNRRGHSLMSEEVRAQTNVSVKDIPSIVDAVFDSFHHMVSFQLDADQLPLIVKIEARPNTLNNSEEILSNTLHSSEASAWQVLLQQPIKSESEHIVYLPSASINNNPASESKSSNIGQTYAEMRISLCLQFNQSLCGYQQPVKMDLISSLSRENKVYSIDQLVLLVSVGGCLALAGVLLLSVVCKRRDRLAKKKQEFDSESDSDSRSKVNTLGSGFFGAHDNKALVGSNDEPTKMLPPPMYSTGPNTPTTSVNTALNNNLLLNGNTYGNAYGAQNTGYYMPDDPSPNSSNETAQSDLWVMKGGEMLMPDGTIAYQQNIPTNQPEMMMNGLSNSYHHLNQPQPTTPHLLYGNQMDYSYSYYPQSDDPYPGMGEDAYTIKNSLYAPYYDESAYGTTKSQHAPPPPPLPSMAMDQQQQQQQQQYMNGNEYGMNGVQMMNQYHQSQPQLVFDEETGYSSRQANADPNANRVIREIIV